MDKKTVSFENAIIKNHEQLKTHLKALLSIISNLKLSDNERVDQAKAHCINVVKQCNTLQDILSAEDSPDWLTHISHNCKLYMNKNYDPNPFSKVFENYQKAISHTWQFGSTLHGIDFDAIYQKYKNESELPKLIDELISLLEKLINENGEELQTKTLNDLTKLLDTIVKNKEASSTALESSLYLIYEFFKNTFFALFPAIQITADGIRTIKQIGKVLQNAHLENQMIQKQIRKETQKKLASSITYTANGVIDESSIIPKNVLEHYVDIDS